MNNGGIKSAEVVQDSKQRGSKLNIKQSKEYHSIHQMLISNSKIIWVNIWPKKN